MFNFALTNATVLRRAQRAFARGEWARAASYYAVLLARKPREVGLRVQMGHALKEAGRLAEAEAAYRQAAADGPDDADAPFHLGLLLLKRERAETARDAFALALSRAPLHAGAFDALWRAGQLLNLPGPVLGKIRSALRADLAERETERDRLQHRLRAAERYPLSDYASIRGFMTLTAPDQRIVAPVHVIIDAQTSAPSYIYMTLQSLRSSRDDNWRAWVHADVDGCDHPVASMASTDERITFVSAANREASSQDAVVYVTAGTTFEAEAIGWIRYTLVATSAAAIISDWDRAEHSWDGNVEHTAPHLNGVFDPDLCAACPEAPPMVVMRSGSLVAMPPEGRRGQLLSLYWSGAAIAHLPLPLISIGGVSRRSRIASENGVAMPLCSQEAGALNTAAPLPDGPFVLTQRQDRPPLTTGTNATDHERIRVIIPTRDCADLLQVAVESMIATASRPDQLTWSIMDNRSTEAATACLLADLSGRSGFTIVRDDNPFNWSAINNRGAAIGDEEILVLANNDIKLLSLGWDDRLRAQLNRPDVGIIGARMLYADGAIQHAGMVFGLGDGTPTHDGVGMDLPEPEREPRFDRCRACSAVTGAFLAIRRDMFTAVGRLDAARLLIAYNDIDLCLAVRDLGKVVLYDPGVELIHYESRSRGFNDNRRKVAWDQEELASLYRKWGESVRHEPAISPWWAREAVYTAYRPISHEEISEWLTNSYGSAWKPRRT